MPGIRAEHFILQLYIPTLVPGSITTSPDLRRAAYISRFRNGQCVIVDGVEGQLWDGIGDHTLAFSPDSRHVAYLAGTQSKQLIVFDASPGTHYDLTLKGSLCFSPTSDRLAYGAKIGERWHVVVDAVEQPGYDHVAELVFSPNGRRLGYAAVDQRGSFFVVDSTATRAYEGILRNSSAFSPDSAEFACGVQDKGQQVLLRNGEEVARYPGLLGRPVYSPDGRHFLHAANDGTRQFVVVDGMPCSPFDYIVLGENETFSPDGEHVSYVIKQGEHQHVTLDHVPGPPFDEIAGRSVRFSPNGLSTAYAARIGNHRFAVCDGQRHAHEGDNVWSLAFSPNSERLAYVVVNGRRHSVVVDDRVVHECDGVLSTADGRGIAFDDERSLHFIELAGGRLQSIDLEL
jgi:hypothetical protein